MAASAFARPAQKLAPPVGDEVRPSNVLTNEADGPAAAGKQRRAAMEDAKAAQSLIDMTTTSEDKEKNKENKH